MRFLYSDKTPFGGYPVACVTNHRYLSSTAECPVAFAAITMSFSIVLYFILKASAIKDSCCTEQRKEHKSCRVKPGNLSELRWPFLFWKWNFDVTWMDPTLMFITKLRWSSWCCQCCTSCVRTSVESPRTGSLTMQSKEINTIRLDAGGSTRRLVWAELAV